MKYISFLILGVIAFAVAKSASDYNYCSANLVGPSVDTEGLKLVLLQGISRHGDRTPANYYPQMENDTPVVWNCSLEQFETPVSFSDSWMYNAPSRLFRRVYLPDVEVLPGNCYFGQLTETGFNQTRDYGAALRSVYVDKYGFLPSYLSYENFNTIWFRTTDLYRTHQSLESQINGLFPPHVAGGAKVQNVAVHTRDVANEIMWPNTDICPTLAAATNKVIESAAFQAIETRMMPIKNSLMSLWNMTTNNFPGWTSLFDVVLCRQCHGQPLPLGLTPDIVSAIVTAANQEFTLLNNDPTCGRLGMGQFTAELVNNIEKKISGASKLKYIAYSGHDTTVGPLLGNWGVYDGNWPPYTANVQIELWFNPQGSAQQQTQYFVQIKYNGDVLQLPGCSTQMCNYYQELKPYLVSRSATAQDCF